MKKITGALRRLAPNKPITNVAEALSFTHGGGEVKKGEPSSDRSKAQVRAEADALTRRHTPVEQLLRETGSVVEVNILDARSKGGVR